MGQAKSILSAYVTSAQEGYVTVTRWTWLMITIFYAVFFCWYTSFEGLLTQPEIDNYLMKLNFTDLELSNFRRFMMEDDGKDFVMINIIEMNQVPLQIEGVEPGETSDQGLAKYMEYMLPAMLFRASHPVFSGKAASRRALDLLNADGMEKWSIAVGVRYRSRRDLIEIATDPAFSGRHQFKMAALKKTIALPVAPFHYLGDPRLILGLLLGLFGCLVGWYRAHVALSYR